MPSRWCKVTVKQIRDPPLSQIYGETESGSWASSNLFNQIPSNRIWILVQNFWIDYWIDLVLSHFSSCTNIALRMRVKVRQPCVLPREYRTETQIFGWKLCIFNEVDITLQGVTLLWEGIRTSCICSKVKFFLGNPPNRDVSWFPPKKPLIYCLPERSSIRLSCPPLLSPRQRHIWGKTRVIRLRFVHLCCVSKK